ncbi:hypothetical protein LEMLEM_LOCUS16057 [Lemmus lemmus]
MVSPQLLLSDAFLWMMLIR